MKKFASAVVAAAIIALSAPAFASKTTGEQVFAILTVLYQP